MKSQIFPALKLTFLCLILFSVIYPLSVWAIAQLASNNGRGEVVEKDGHIIGFANVGQSFTDDKYFNSRPSAVGYNAAASGGSNKGPSNPNYMKTVQERIDTFLVHNPSVKKAQIPSELVTASGSGLDPHLSPQGALIQIPRIAKSRGISEDKLRDLVERQTSKPIIGMPTVNILSLNLALDALK